MKILPKFAQDMFLNYLQGVLCLLIPYSLIVLVLILLKNKLQMPTPLWIVILLLATITLCFLIILLIRPYKPFPVIPEKTVTHKNHPMEEKDKKDIIKLIYPAILSEIDRYRDWPIRVLTFTSVLHLAIIGYRLTSENHFIWYVNYSLAVFIIILFVFTFAYFYRCHVNYIKNRNVQARLQVSLKADELNSAERIFPSEWLKERKVSGKTGFWGWGFYIVYAAGLSIATIIVLFINVVLK